MATLREIRNAIADDLRAQGLDESNVLIFKDVFASRLRFRSGMLATTDVELTLDDDSEAFVYVDEQDDGSYVSVMRTDVSEVKRYW